MYRVLHERSNITACFAEHLEVQENLTFTHSLWISSGKSKQKTKIRTLYILKMLYAGCSTKDAISLLPSGTRAVSRTNDFYAYTMGK